MAESEVVRRQSGLIPTRAYAAPATNRPAPALPRSRAAPR